MATYYNHFELKNSLQNLIKQYISECKENNQLSQHCLELIKHNFFAEYVVYNKISKTVEVGIDTSTNDAVYQNIESYFFKLDEIEKKLDDSFRKKTQDLEFYGKLVNRAKGINTSSVVVF